QRRKHRGEDTDEKNGDLPDRFEIKVIGLVDLFSCREIRTGGRGKHQTFAEKDRLFDENGEENDREKNDVDEAVEFPLILRFREFRADFSRRFQIVSAIHPKEKSKHEGNGSQPDEKA